MTYEHEEVARTVEAVRRHRERSTKRNMSAGDRQAIADPDAVRDAWVNGDLDGMKFGQYWGAPR